MIALVFTMILRAVLAAAPGNASSAAPATVTAPPAPPTAPAATTAGTAPAASVPAVEAASSEAELDAQVQRLQARLAELDAQVQQLQAQVDRLETQRSVASETRATAGPDHEAVAGADQAKGGRVVKPGQTLEDAVALTGPVDVYGVVRGNAVAVGGDVRVHAGGQVSGDAVSFGGKVKVDPGGRVDGDRVSLGPTRAAMATILPGWATHAASGLARRLAAFLSIAGAGVLIVGFWPRQVRTIAWAITDRPFWYSVAGAILTGGITVGATALLLTVVGIPIALLLVGLLGVSWLIGVVAVCLAAGERLRPRRSRLRDWVTFLLGAVLLALVGLLPSGIGLGFLALVGLPAIGAALLTRLGNREVSRGP